MEERILILLEKEKIALSVSEINDHLDLKTIDELKELLKALNNLEDTLKLYRTNKDKYMIFNNSNLQLGKMITHKKGFGFVDIEGDIDVFVAPNNINNAIHGDTVVVEITSKKGIELEGRIVRIVDRKIRPMVGEFYEENGKGKIKLDDEKVKLDITIPNPNGAVDGNKVLVKVTNKLQNNNYNGEILEVLGHKNDPGVDILSIVYKYGINTVFSEEVLNELDKIQQSVKEEEMISRKDLREEIIFTIDGADTKDIDDAISIEKLENGNYNLGVHIADVSYYVKENTEIDKEAYDRGTSVYLADRVIPMLPHKLSNGICSLNPNVDRLAMSCSMEIDKDGNVVDYNIFESVINSKIKMTYTSVNDYLENNKVNEGYEPFTEKLSLMKDLADILRANKDKRGYIDFNIDESKIIVNEQGEAVDVKLRDRGTGEKLIEDFMIAANETVATHIYFMDLPFIYRIHGIPKEERVENFLKFIKVLGYNITTDKANITPKTMQAILLELKDKKEFHILSSLLLRSMQKAIYDKSNIGHFGLASKYYTHFTSPIRRYPDTTVHRLLRTYLFENKLDHETIRYWDNKLEFLAQHSSEKERSSVSCEREVDDMKKAEYMEKHIGEEFDGVISSITSFGMFVELPNLIEGLIKISEIRGDYFVFDETTFSLVGRSSKKAYRLGEKIRVVVSHASKESKTVDFEIAKKVKDGNTKQES